MLDKYRLLRFMLFIPAERRRPCQNLRPKGATFPTTPIVPTTPITPIQRGVLQIHGNMLDKYRLLRFMLFIPAERRRPCQNLRPKGATFPTTPIVPTTPITPIQNFFPPSFLSIPHTPYALMECKARISAKSFLHSPGYTDWE